MSYLSFRYYLNIARLSLKYIDKLIFGNVEEISIFHHKDTKAVKIYPTNNFHMPPLKDIEGNRYNISYDIVVPEACIFTVNNGMIFPGREEIYASDRNIFKEITSQKINPITGSSKRKLRNYTKLDGRVLCLSLSNLERNYYHFNVELMARWYIFKLSKLDFDYVDFDCETNFQKDFVELLGIKKEKLIPSNLRNTLIQADVLIVPSLINNWEYYQLPGDKLHYMKQYLPVWFKNIHEEFRNKSTASNKIYISRSKANYRRIINEKEVIKLISNFGFSVYDLETLSAEEQILLFNNAEMIIAPHGAGIVNIVYSSKKFSFLEIFPENYFDSSFRILAQVLDCEYNFLIGNCPNSSVNDPQKEDIYVDCQKLKKWLKKSVRL